MGCVIATQQGREGYRERAWRQRRHDNMKGDGITLSGKRDYERRISTQIRRQLVSYVIAKADTDAMKRDELNLKATS